MKDSIRRIITFLFLLVGLGLINYPFFSQWFNSLGPEEIISDYEQTILEMEDDQVDELLMAARAYNEALTNSSMILQDAFSTAKQMDDTYASLLNIDSNGIMGYLEISKIDVRLPIYHGTSIRVLEAGVGHLEGSSLPVGGISTHAVLSAHSGLPSKTLFTDLDQLDIGDVFKIYVLDEKLAYEVDQILVVEPDETEALNVQEGEDKVTLVTCTPYGVNSHRLFVQAHRIDWVEEETEEEIVLGKWQIHQIVAIISAVILVLVAIFLFRRRNSNEEDH